MRKGYCNNYQIIASLGMKIRNSAMETTIQSAIDYENTFFLLIVGTHF